MATIMASVSGIRGVIGDGFSPDVIARYAAAYGTYIDAGTVVVGGDSRPSREMVRSALFAGLTSVGCRVIDLGLATTPTIELMVEKLGADGGVCVTASHNPVTWNAMKFLDKQARFFGPEEGGEVIRIFEENEQEYVGVSRLGKIETFDKSSEYHIQRILEHPLVDVAAIRRRQFRVAIDAVNSVGNVIMPNLLHELGCDIVKIHSDLSGEFARGAEPLPENLTDLSELVCDEGTDIGFALDPDADRLAIVDEQGSPIGEENTLALVVRHVLNHKKAPVVVNLSTSRASEDIARDAGVEFYRSPVGEYHVAKKMDEVGSEIGGEGNGGVMLASLHANRDGMIGAALVLTLLAKEEVPLSLLMSRMPQYIMIKRRASAEGVSLDSLEGNLRAEFGENAKIDSRDGIRVDLKEGWASVRFSNTEPIVRIFSEAHTREIADQLANRAAAALKG